MANAPEHKAVSMKNKMFFWIWCKNGGFVHRAVTSTLPNNFEINKMVDCEQAWLPKTIGPH